MDEIDQSTFVGSPLRSAGLLQTETTAEQQRSGEPQSIVPSDTSVLRGFANVQGRMK